MRELSENEVAFISGAGPASGVAGCALGTSGFVGAAVGGATSGALAGIEGGAIGMLGGAIFGAAIGVAMQSISDAVKISNCLANQKT